MTIASHTVNPYRAERNAIYPPETWEFKCPGRAAASDLYHRYIDAGYNATRSGLTVYVHPTDAETVNRRMAANAR
jgi:hypothetical protein